MPLARLLHHLGRSSFEGALRAERFKAVGQEVWPANAQTPTPLAAKEKAEITRWSPVIKEAGITVQ